MRVNKKQSKATDYFKSQHGGNPHTGLRIPDITDVMERTNNLKKKNVSKPNDNLSKPDDESKPDDNGPYKWNLVNETRNRRFQAQELNLQYQPS